MRVYSDWEMEEAKRHFNNVVVNDDIITWKSNGQSPMLDMLERWLQIGLITMSQFSKTNENRNEQTKVNFARYIENQKNKNIYDEEIIEMQANFGKGTGVQNIITGKTFKL